MGIEPNAQKTDVFGGWELPECGVAGKAVMVAAAGRFLADGSGVVDHFGPRRVPRHRPRAPLCVPGLNFRMGDDTFALLTTWWLISTNAARKPPVVRVICECRHHSCVEHLIDNRWVR